MDSHGSNTLRMGVHPTAIVDEGAQIGEGVSVGPYATIGPSAVIGDDTRIHSHVVVEGNTTIGSGCEIFPFAVLGTFPQDKKLDRAEHAELDRSGVTLQIGDRNKIREHVTVHGGTPFGAGQTIVGDDNMLLAGCHIGHDAVVGSRVIFTNGAMAAGHCVIEDDVILGAMVGVHQFSRVGAFAMIGAGSMLSHDAPPFALAQGDRARLVGVNIVGLKRGSFDTEQSARIKRVFRLLFWRDGVLSERIANARAFAGDDPHSLQIVDFVESSKRGVCARRARSSSNEDPYLDS